jgi:phosphatidylinositol 4-kinase
MGRSFALEMGSLIPQNDHRLGKYTLPIYSITFNQILLGSIESLGVTRVNVASNFIAQHTARQKYRRTGQCPVWSTSDDADEHLDPGLKLLEQGDSSSFKQSKCMEQSLLNIHKAVHSGKQVALPKIRDTMQRAAALLCGSNAANAVIAHYLVSLPFQIFSKESIEIGVSLWLGVMHENPKLEPTILFEVVQQWENTILRRQGLFDPSFR